MTGELTPSEVVTALDRHIVGQQAAKRAVAIAIRNRWRRRQLDPETRDEVMPKNIILIGSTGVGKTEIARRVAQLVRAPFIKVEASKYTEVGYYGRDVETMARDLVDVSLALVRAEELARVQESASEAAEERLLDLLVGRDGEGVDDDERERRSRTRATFRGKLRAGELDVREVEVEVESAQTPFIDIFSSAGVEQLGLDLPGLMNRLGRSRSSEKRLPVSEARKVLEQQEAEKLVDEDRIQQEAVARAEQTGIIFLDEIDKIITTAEGARGAEVSREGVQRDLLPLVEGSTVNTRHGMVRTDHILFIGAGAFHGVRPTDLIPELQGRFPIRVELASLTREDFARILREPRNALPQQYAELLATDGVKVRFTADGIDRIAELAWDLNQSQQNIGARRLYALIEKLLEEPLFLAPDALPAAGRALEVDRAYVDTRLGYLTDDAEQSAYIL